MYAAPEYQKGFYETFRAQTYRSYMLKAQHETDRLTKNKMVRQRAVEVYIVKTKKAKKKEKCKLNRIYVVLCMKPSALLVAFIWAERTQKV